MGLFSSKKKVTVDTTVSRAIEDNLLPDSPKQGAIEGIFSNDGQLVEHIMEKDSFQHSTSDIITNIDHDKKKKPLPIGFERTNCYPKIHVRPKTSFHVAQC